MTATPHLTRRLRPFILSAMLGVLTACGGGGSGGGGGGTGSGPAPYVADLPASAASASDPNVAIVEVRAGPRNNVNIPFVTIRLCVPGTAICKTIDNILVDTGSAGLRIFASHLAVAPALTLPAHSIGASTTISECALFLNALAWGAVKVADLTIGNKTASSVAVQVMETTSPPSTCGSARLLAPPEYASTAGIDPLSANGILGVSQFVNDGQIYFNCASPTSTSCRIFPAAGDQVQNPVALFSSDNNGVVLQMPAVPATGAALASGYLIFGVGTRANNLLGNTRIVPLNTSGFFTTVYKGVSKVNSFMDSGSNGIYFFDASISQACSRTSGGFYCPPSTQNLSATMLLGGSSVNVAFSIANSDSLFAPGSSSYAFNNLGGTFSSSNAFDWGLPFFFGRSVFTVMEGRTAGGSTGPFYAFTDLN